MDLWAASWVMALFFLKKQFGQGPGDRTDLYSIRGNNPVMISSKSAIEKLNYYVDVQQNSYISLHPAVVRKFLKMMLSAPSSML